MGISTGVGLISGIDIESIVTQLMAIERQPVNRLGKKVEELTAEKAAFSTISAQLLSLKTNVTPLKSGVNFRLNSASSSNENVLSSTASSTAVPGSYTFTVKQTAQSHQMVSQGFYDPNQSAIGTGTISFELGSGNLDRDTDLGMLRNQQGIRRGEIRVTDRSGASADIDLSTALTVSDVLDAINNAHGINVTARVDGDQIVLDDNTGAITNNLQVVDLNDGYAAADLGIAGNVAASTITGSDLVSLSSAVALKSLNDGNGVRTNNVAADIQFTLRDGTSFGVDLNAAIDINTSLDVMNGGQGIRDGSIKITNKAGVSETIDFSGAQTISDVLDAINGSGLSLTASWINGKQLSIGDASTGEGTLTVEDVDGGSTMTDLGLDAISKTNTLGDAIFHVTTLGDVARVIEEAAARATGEAGKVSVSLAADGKRLEFVDNTGGAGDLTIESVLGSKAAEDLGLAGTYTTSTATGSRLVAGLNTVLLKNLNGGSGVNTGIIEIQDRNGVSKQIDLTGVETLNEVLDAINNDPDLNVQARLNDARTGIVIQDITGSTAANFKISDVNSSMAADLGIAADQASNRVDSGNNQLQYISQTTRLSELRSGQGISAGSFTIVDSKGIKSTLTLSSSNVAEMTVGDLIDKINSLSVGVQAGINANGDGIILTDTAGGTGMLTVRDSGTSTTAADLRLAGSADQFGAGTINGSYEYSIAIGGSDTLGTLVDKINKLGGPVKASVINDGSSGNAYHLSLTSEISGMDGRIILNTGAIDLGLFDIVEAQDAVIALGGGSNAIVASSSTNTFKNLVEGLTLTAGSVSDNPITITVARNNDSVIEKMNAFVEQFNAVLSSISEVTKYDAETEEAGILLGNNTIRTVQSKILSAISKTLGGSGNIQRLSQLGIKIGSDSKLEFDEEKFRGFLESNEPAVESFFATKDEGFAYVFSDIIDDLTDSYSGLITSTTDGYDSRVGLLNDRIEYLEKLLESKEQRLYKQYQNMEAALANMQTMSNALSSMTTIEPISNNDNNN
jgi:flagellar hook-associated protein 2